MVMRAEAAAAACGAGIAWLRKFPQDQNILPRRVDALEHEIDLFERSVAHPVSTEEQYCTPTGSCWEVVASPETMRRRYHERAEYIETLDKMRKKVDALKHAMTPNQETMLQRRRAERNRRKAIEQQLAKDSWAEFQRLMAQDRINET